MSNRLAGATSPYLLQHADNPVDWYPWSDEAFERARREDKPVFVSIGYASCHWCHVMAHESFEDPDTAEYMNRNFVSIKVDREERPDVDAIYMNALQSMTGSGGWPLNVVTTADGEPFFAGTYFGPDERHGRPSFRTVLEGVMDAWRERRAEVRDTAEAMRERLRALSAPMAVAGASAVAADDVDASALRALTARYDDRHGGFGGAPKFPPHATLAYLLERSEPEALRMVRGTLDGMARGGIFDQLGGGFSRYSVDERWDVPHFEKMLYDNASLLQAYARAYARTADAEYRRVVDLTLGWLEREMVSPAGGFYSAIDADSEGEEGRYYSWTADEFRAVTGTDAALAARVFGVSSPGPFEGKNVLKRAEDVTAAGQALGLDGVQAHAAIERAGAALFAARAQRPRPALDDKVLASWNGMMLEALAEVAALLGDERADRLARANVAFVRSELWRDGTLFHAHRAGSSHIDGLLEDYAHYGLGLLALYRRTLEPDHLRWALELGRTVQERFEDAVNGGFYTVASNARASNGPALLVRPRTYQDGATPSDNAVAAELMLGLGRTLGDEAMVLSAERAVRPLADAMRRYPQAFGTSLRVHARLRRPSVEVVLVGRPGNDDLQALERVWRRYAQPDVVVLRVEGPSDPLASLSRLAEGRVSVDGRATAYVCQEGACRLPVTDASAFERQLDEVGVPRI